ncbi:MULTISPECIES: hypothetical protein [unclassified Sphingomonas]|uniref:hypothetical protein n=1 Tax=unclassified Sphingomonas TaxID=196159 RepID=UPI002269D4F0|nr:MULTISPECIES: hypothetical protein [unclassified Sphingomonas]
MIPESTNGPDQAGAELLPFVAPTSSQMRAAAAIVDSPSVIGAYAAYDWGELSEAAQVWIAAIVREARR